MKEKTLIQKFLGTWNTKTIVGVAIGAALFGVLMNYGSIRVFTNTSLTTAMIVPVIVGALFGPLPAAAAAGIGNVIADLIGGWGFWFDWSIGNAVLGLFVGALPLYGAYIEDGIFELKHMIIYAVVVIVGTALAFGLVTPFFTYLWYGGELTITLYQGVVGSVSNIIVLLVAGIPVLKVLAARNAKASNLRRE
ncbi:MAG: ECF-type riboflavin transporter substrate-binding protein [Lachnospiraceae bacterium]|nr:ECF-type riboflavin transporter substrate-binding protein [Lachnospiraceae bacterium]